MNIRIIGMSIIAMAWTSIALADLILPGNKAVDHQLVFQDSELFQRYRFVAAPIAGFQGVAVIQPGVSFRFSSKYGTKIYVVPDGQPDPVQYDREAFEAYNQPNQQSFDRVEVEIVRRCGVDHRSCGRYSRQNARFCNSRAKFILG